MGGELEQGSSLAGETDQYIQSAAGTPSSADQIASAKALLDAGAITQTEYERLMSKALA